MVIYFACVTSGVAIDAPLAPYLFQLLSEIEQAIA